MYDIVGSCFFFQAEDGIRDLVRSRGLGDVYKRQDLLYVDIYVDDDIGCSFKPDIYFEI